MASNGPGSRVNASLVGEKPNNPQGKPMGFPEGETLAAVLYPTTSKRPSATYQLAWEEPMIITRTTHRLNIAIPQLPTLSASAAGELKSDGKPSLSGCDPIYLPDELAGVLENLRGLKSLTAYPTARRVQLSLFFRWGNRCSDLFSSGSRTSRLFRHNLRWQLLSVSDESHRDRIDAVPRIFVRKPLTE